MDVITELDERNANPVKYLVEHDGFSEEEAVSLIERANHILEEFSPDDFGYNIVSSIPLLLLGKISAELRKSIEDGEDAIDQYLMKNGLKMKYDNENIQKSHHELALRYYATPNNEKRRWLDCMEVCENYAKILVILKFTNDLNQANDEIEVHTVNGDIIIGESEFAKFPQLPYPLWYDAFSFLNEEQVKDVLTCQSPHCFNLLLDGYNTKNRKKFDETVDCLSYQIAPMPKLYDYLCNVLYEENENFKLALASPEFSLAFAKEEVAKITGRPDFVCDFEDYLQDVQNGELLIIQDKMQIAVDFFIAILTLQIGWFKHSNQSVLLQYKVKVKYDLMRELIQNLPEFEAIAPVEHYIYEDVLKKLAYKTVIKALSELHESHIAVELSEAVGTTTEESLVPFRLSGSPRLDFPTRFSNNPDRIGSNFGKEIMQEIFELYGNGFENITRDEFLYLFGITNKMPNNYNPPYYWSGPENTMKAFIRILYTPQPKELKKLILHTSDKAEGKTEHNWAQNKDKVAYLDMENTIAKIVFECTKKTLKPL